MYHKYMHDDNFSAKSRF